MHGRNLVLDEYLRINGHWHSLPALFWLSSYAASQQLALHHNLVQKINFIVLFNTQI
jgi:hypothetical protein